MNCFKNLFVLGCLLGLPAFQALAQTSEDKTLSPYFLVKGDKPGVDVMPLKATEAQVQISGVIADVEVKQVYVNEGEQTLEAIYVFPGSTRAAVYGMTMQIGERRLVAKIEEKQKARAQYETAKEEGRTASLLEQLNPNVFQMNVANILPGDSITVSLRYTELLEPNAGVYEFVYPTVVGPRYSESLANDPTASDKWVQNPYLQEGEAPNYTFGLQARIQTGVPIQDITSTSHEVDITFRGKEQAEIRLGKKEKFAGNKDFILQYRLRGGQIETGLLLSASENAVADGSENRLGGGEDENFFLLMMQPPKLPKLEDIPPREYVFIVDVSGSMHGFPLGVSKKLLRDLIGNLRPSDRFNVMLFESSNQMMSPESLPANEANIQKAIEVIEQQRGSGGTRLMPALQEALNFKETKDFSRSFVVITDGYVTVEREAFDLISNNLNEANLFAFGIGSSVNRYLIEGLARVGFGEPFFLTQQSEAKAIGDKFRQYIEQPVLTNIQIEYQGLDVYDVEPRYIPDVFAERPILVYGKFKGAAQGSITLRGKSGNKPYTQTIYVSKSTAQENQALRYLWARKRIQRLDDYRKLSPGRQDDKIKEEVTRLGLEYNLLTAYTSFIAEDTEVRNGQGNSLTVKQPLPMPAGVSNQALGTKSGNPRKYKKVTGSVERSFDESDEEETISLSQDILIEQEENKPVPVVGITWVSGKASPPSTLDALKKHLRQFQDLSSYQGEVLIRFEVREDGSLGAFQILKSPHPNVDQTLIQALKSSGTWNPAQRKGKKQNTRVTLRLQLPLL